MSVEHERYSKLRSYFTPYRIWLVVTFFLLSGWAAINYSHGHRFYALFIIGFYLVSLLLPKPSFTLVLVSVVAYVFLSSVSFSAFTQVRKTVELAMENPSQPIKNLLLPHTGLDVLPEPVLQMLAMIDEHAITSYRLSPKLNADYHIVQRIVESAWPLRMTEQATYVFTAKDETGDFSTCKLIDQAEEVALVNCP